MVCNDLQFELHVKRNVTEHPGSETVLILKERTFIASYNVQSGNTLKRDILCISKYEREWYTLILNSTYGNVNNVEI